MTQGQDSTPTSRALAGYVYFIQAEDGGPIKIGIAADPKKRRDNLQAGNPSRLVIRRTISVWGERFRDGSVSWERLLGAEASLHIAYEKYHIRGEWYRPVLELAEAAWAIPEGGSQTVNERQLRLWAAGVTHVTRQDKIRRGMLSRKLSKAHRGR